MAPIRRSGRWLALVGALLVTAVAGAPCLAAQQQIRIGLLLPDAADRAEAAASARMGAELGAEEARRLVQLLGGELELVSASAATPGETAAAARRLIAGEGVFALIGGFDPETCAALGDLAEREGVVFLNIGCAADSLRRDRCWANTFHVAASEAMRRDALAAVDDSAASPALWHASLYRYGATQLNDRFGERFQRPMDGTSWAAWFAVKSLAESAVRARSTDAPVVAAHLVAERTRFDGHKGRSLSFRPWDHQLRQPIYVVMPGADGGEVAGEAPQGRPAPDQSTEAFLDQIGDRADATRCRRAPVATGADRP